MREDLLDEETDSAWIMSSCLRFTSNLDGRVSKAATRTNVGLSEAPFQSSQHPRLTGSKVNQTGLNYSLVSSRH